MPEIVFQLLTEILKLIAIAAGYFLIGFLMQHLSEQRFKIVRAIVRDGVLFAQQVYGHLDGEVRYEKALERISAALADYGITVNEEQLDAMIEAMVKALKKEFGDDWYPGNDEE